jgi:hypothetical protein
LFDQGHPMWSHKRWVVRRVYCCSQSAIQKAIENGELSRLQPETNRLRGSRDSVGLFQGED